MSSTVTGHRPGPTSSLLTVIVFVGVAAGAVLGWFTRPLVHRVTNDGVAGSRVAHAGLIAVIGGVTAWAIGESLLLPAWLFVMGVGGVLSLVDVTHHLLPKRMVWPMYPVTLLLLALPVVDRGDWSLFGGVLVGGAIAFGVYFCLALINPAGLGWGDIRFAGPLGFLLGWWGWQFVLAGCFFAFILAALVNVALLATKRMERGAEYPFGPYMVASTLAIAVGVRLLTGG